MSWVFFGENEFFTKSCPQLSKACFAANRLKNCLSSQSYAYCNRTKFRTRFNFVYFVLLAESTKFSSIRKPYTYTSVSDTTVAVRKFLAYESWQTLEYEIFTRTKISAITVFSGPWCSLFSCDIDILIAYTVHICYSVGLWFSKIYHYNRCIITSDVHSLRSSREPLFPARAYPRKLYTKYLIPGVWSSFWAFVLSKFADVFFLLWLTNKEENLLRGKLRNVEHWLA